jgi:hypothetical protein
MKSARRRRFRLVRLEAGSCCHLPCRTAELERTHEQFAPTHDALAGWQAQYLVGKLSNPSKVSLNVKAR